jgi:hypothetical protein
MKISRAPVATSCHLLVELDSERVRGLLGRVKADDKLLAPAHWERIVSARFLRGRLRSLT